MGRADSNHRVGAKARAQFTEVEGDVRMVGIDAQIADIQRVGAVDGECAHLLIEEKADFKSFVDVEASTETP